MYPAAGIRHRRWQDSDKRKGFRSLHLAARDGAS
jgi:hypothetical protein